MSQPSLELGDIETNILGNLLSAAMAYSRMDYDKAAHFMKNAQGLATPETIFDLGKRLSEFADTHYPNSGSQKRNEMREALKK